MSGGPGTPAESESAERQANEARREALSMGIYLSLVLAAELGVISDQIQDGREIAALIWGTALGLTIAHLFAFNLAARLFEGSRLTDYSRMAVLYQVLVAVGVAALLTVPLLVASPARAVTVASYLVAGIIGLVGFLAVRAHGGSVLRAALFALAMVAVAVLVVVIKVAMGH